MTLSPGQRLGPFEIVSAIGAGGMGEVWKAKDTRLDRTVALKVLPAELAADPERRRRLEQEARAVASPGTKRGLGASPRGRRGARSLSPGWELRHGRASALSRRRWLAYIASDTGRFEVYLHSLDGGERARVSKDGGGQPRWRDDQRELFFLGLDGTLMSVDFDAQRGRAEIAKPLFQTGLSVDPTIDQYGVAPDGEKFLFLLPAGSDEPITVVVNWKTLLGS